VSRLRDEEFIRTHAVGGWNSLGWVGDEIVTPQAIERGGQLLAAARTAAAKDEQAMQRVEFLGKGLVHTRLVVETMRAYRAWKANPGKLGLPKEFTGKLHELDGYRQTIKSDYVVDLALLRKLELWSGWRSGRPGGSGGK